MYAFLLSVALASASQADAQDAADTAQDQSGQALICRKILWHHSPTKSRRPTCATEAQWTAYEKRERRLSNEAFATRAALPR